MKNALSLNIRFVSFGVPYIEEHLAGIQDFWRPKVDIIPSLVLAHSEGAEMMQWSAGTSVLDTAVVNRWKDSDFDITALIAPYFVAPESFKGVLSPSVFGLMISAENVIEVFADDGAHDYGGGRDLGSAFEVWFNHELSHYLYLNILKAPDRTHEWFYSPNFSPESARSEIFSLLP